MKFEWFNRLFGPAPAPEANPRLLITAETMLSLIAALQDSRARRHEGIAYLLGRTDGQVTLAIAVFAPEAHTTSGSFHVPTRSMIACMQAAAKFELQIVAQVHTHPGEAYHSDGDIEGAKIRYPGYASVVLPDYGRHLPSLQGAAGYVWSKTRGWIELPATDMLVIPQGGPWTSANSTAG